MADYHLGQTATITLAFVDTDGDPATPDSATLQVEAPDGTLAGDYDLADLSAGVTGTYTKIVTYDQAGEWIWRAIGVIGATAAVDTDRDWVWPNPITAVA